MKIFKNIFIILIISCTKVSIVSSRKTRNNQLLSEAFLDVINELYIRPRIEFKTLIFEGVSFHVHDVVDGLRRGGFITSHLRYRSNQRFTLIKSLIIFCESLEEVKKFLGQHELGGKNIAEHFRFLFYVKKPFNVTQIGSEKPHAGHGVISWYTYFITQEKEEIHLKTIKWFTELKCGEEQVITLNSFNLKLKNWKNPLRIRDNFESYHGCTINFWSRIFRMYLIDSVVDVPILLSLMQKKLVDVFLEIGDMRDKIENDFTQIFAQQGNFTINRNKTHKDMELFTSYLMFIDYIHFTTDFFQEEYSLITTPAEPYSSYEKLILPFDVTTWICLIIIFGISFAVIFLVNRTSNSTQNIVFGDKVQHPSLNVVGAFFGINQNRAPQNNFARAIFILFVLFCLIIRTAYQGRI